MRYCVSSFIFFLLLQSCENKVSDIPKLSTNTISEITINSAKSGGTIISTGGGSILSRGVCWSTSPNPSMTNNHTSDEDGAGSFESILINLNSNTQYYVRAYAENEAGVAYGESLEFETLMETGMEDKLQRLFHYLIMNSVISGLPNTYREFAESLKEDKEVAESFYRFLKDDLQMSDMPNTFVAFCVDVGLIKEELAYYYLSDVTYKIVTGEERIEALKEKMGLIEKRETEVFAPVKNEQNLSVEQRKQVFQSKY